MAKATQKPATKSTKPANEAPPEVTDEDAAGVENEEVQPTVVERVFNGAVEFVTDLFRLRTAQMIKNTHWNKEQPNFVKVDHEHFFHTYDSNAKKMTESNAVGGHFHIMEVVPSQNGGVPVVRCSGPKKWVFKKGKKFMVDATESTDPLDHKGKPHPGYDNHTHEVAYERSSRMKPRIVNAESVKILNEDANKAIPIPGIRA